MLLSPRWRYLGDKWASDDERKEINLIWHKLERGSCLTAPMRLLVKMNLVYLCLAWPDTIKGLQRLRSKFIVSTLSNGNIRLQVDMVRPPPNPRTYDLTNNSFIVDNYPLRALTLPRTPHTPSPTRPPTQPIILAPLRLELLHPDLGQFGIKVAFSVPPDDTGEEPGG